MYSLNCVRGFQRCWPIRAGLPPDRGRRGRSSWFGQA